MMSAARGTRGKRGGGWAGVVELGTVAHGRDVLCSRGKEDKLDGGKPTLCTSDGQLPSTENHATIWVGVILFKKLESKFNPVNFTPFSISHFPPFIKSPFPIFSRGPRLCPPFLYTLLYVRTTRPPSRKHRGRPNYCVTSRVTY